MGWVAEKRVTGPQWEGVTAGRITDTVYSVLRDPFILSYLFFKTTVYTILSYKYSF